jgi:hypothetical protein
VQNLPATCQKNPPISGQNLWQKNLSNSSRQTPVIRRGPSISEDVKSLRKSGLYLESLSSADLYVGKEPASTPLTVQRRLLAGPFRTGLADYVPPQHFISSNLDVASGNYNNTMSDNSSKRNCNRTVYNNTKCNSSIDNQNSNSIYISNGSNNIMGNKLGSSNISLHNTSNTKTSFSNNSKSNSRSKSGTSEQFRAALQLFSRMEKQAKEEGGGEVKNKLRIKSERSSSLGRIGDDQLMCRVGDHKSPDSFHRRRHTANRRMTSSVMEQKYFGGQSTLV